MKFKEKYYNLIKFRVSPFPRITKEDPVIRCLSKTNKENFVQLATEKFNGKLFEKEFLTGIISSTEKFIISMLIQPQQALQLNHSLSHCLPRQTDTNNVAAILPDQTIIHHYYF